MAIVEIGDSLGEDLGFGLQNVIGSKPHIVLETLARGDTGLVDVAYYNWPRVLASYLARYRPTIVIAMFGGNDCQPFYEGSTLESPGTSSFDAVYSARVGALMSEATSAGAHVVWVGMPIMEDPSFAACMAELNRDYATEAASHPGVMFVPTWRLFEGPNGQYAEYLEIDGSLVEVRDPDGVHIDGPAGTDLVGRAVVDAMQAAYHVRF